MRRTEIHERGGIGRAARSGGLSSTESVMRRWRLFEASAPQLDFTGLLPGGQALGPEPGIGFGEEGGSSGLSRAMHLLHLHAFCSAGVPGEESGDETTGDPCLRNHAT